MHTTNLSIQDEHTKNLINGLNLLLTYYPQARVRMGFSEDELHVRGIEDDLILETKKILEDWNWRLNYYGDTYYWEYELIGTIDD